MAAKMVQPAQIRAIYVLARKYGLGDDALHDLVRCQTRRDSIKKLTEREAGVVIERLRALLGEAPARPADRATDRQVKMIYGLAREMGWLEIGEKRLRAFLEKRFGCSDVKFLSAAKVGPVVEAMKAMRDGGRGDRLAEESAGGQP